MKTIVGTALFCGVLVCAGALLGLLVALRLTVAVIATIFEP